jgi:Zn-finger nucleic acid-binding protein
VALFDGEARSGGTLLGCGTCGGVWLDVAACRVVVEGTAGELSRLGEVAARHATVKVDTSGGGLFCPLCGETMAPVALPGTSIVLDSCAQHGTWFDAGELRLIVLAYAKLPPPMRAASPEDYAAYQAQGASFSDGKTRWMLGEDGRWRSSRDPHYDPYLRGDQRPVTVEDAGAFASGLVTFVRGVVDGLRRPD